MREHEKITHARNCCRSHGLRYRILNPATVAQLVIDGVCIAYSLYNLSKADITMLVDIYRESKYLREV